MTDDGKPTILAVELAGLFQENIIAKLWKVATERLENNKAPAYYPEWVPEDGKTPGTYNTKEVNFWTCGFFPGSLYCILERCIRHPRLLALPGGIDRALFHQELLKLCRAWSEPLHRMALRTNSHDLGFITLPALRQDWELTGNRESLASIITAANSLATRYDDRVKAVRSWDKQLNKRFDITDKETNFLVIVDSMCNMDLLFYAGHHSSNPWLIEIATTHAHFVRKHLIRKDSSTWHVVNMDPRDGSLKSKHTHQGYNDDSCWSRGQAWAILGFTQTYIWTRDPVFLETAVAVSEHFLNRLRAATHDHPFVPAWDFDAPPDCPPRASYPSSSSSPPLRDASAGMAAAVGLLLLHQILRAGGKSSSYLDDALRIARETIAMCQANEPARLVPQQYAGHPAGAVGHPAGAVGHAAGANGHAANHAGHAAAHAAAAGGCPIEARGVTFDALLKHATPNAHEFAAEQYYDCGLVYADYFFLLFGNTLLRLGMI